jgi:hypothetical protein
MYLEALER